jgi:hypothetical protein
MKFRKRPLKTAWLRRGAKAIVSFVAIGLLTACKPTAPTSLSDEVALIYASASESSVFFLLENHTSHEIYVPAKRWLWEDATPDDPTIVCITPPPNSSLSQVAPFLPPDISPTPPMVTVSPGSQLRLKIPWNRGEFTSKYKGNHCRLELQLLTGPRITSNQFEP